MSEILPLLVLGVGVAWLSWRDVKERASVSAAVWIVLAWAVIYGSRPVTSWFGGPDQGVVLPEAYDEGNPSEALVYLCAMLAGLTVLLRRGIAVPAVIRENKWLFVFYLFWLVSVTWSDYPVITVKRWVKDLGNVVMVLLILTERDPGQAVRAVFARLAYLCIPLSLLLIRYYPEWGRVYGGYSRNESMFVGVTTHKNSLGVLALVTALFVLWDLLEPRRKRQTTAEKFTYAGRAIVLVICWYLLMRVDSATSLVCAVIGSLLLVALNVPAMRRRPGRIEAYGLGLVLLLGGLEAAFGIKEAIVSVLGRDMTLTTRTDVWPILIGHQDNPLIGAGFNSFWAGRRLVLLSESVGGIIQAHNGYLETYLNGGLIGIGLLLGLLGSAYGRIRRGLGRGSAESGARLVILLLVVVHNLSEASFNKVSILWFAAVFAVMEYGARRSLRPAAPEVRQWRATVATRRR